MPAWRRLCDESNGWREDDEQRQARKLLHSVLLVSVGVVAEPPLRRRIKIFCFGGGRWMVARCDCDDDG